MCADEARRAGGHRAGCDRRAACGHFPKPNLCCGTVPGTLWPRRLRPSGHRWAVAPRPWPRWPLPAALSGWASLVAGAGAGPGPGLFPVLCVALLSASWWQRGLVPEGACWPGPGGTASARAGLRRRPRAARHQSVEARGCCGRSLHHGFAWTEARQPPPSPFLVWHREKGLEGLAPVRCPLRGSHCARNYPERLLRWTWARFVFQERTWSIEGLRNFPEAALGLEPRLS